MLQKAVVQIVTCTFGGCSLRGEWCTVPLTVEGGSVLYYRADSGGNRLVTIKVEGA
jgi:hypothetical protein